MTTKQDLLNKIEGVREITDFSFPYIYVFSTEKILFSEPTFKENDTITVGDHTFIFKDSPNTIYEVGIGDSLFESFSNFFNILIEIVPEYLLEFSVLNNIVVSRHSNININIESVDGIVLNLFNNGCLAIVLESSYFNPVEGDILTIGDTTYTFKETPIEPFDIQIGDEQNSTLSYFILFLYNTPNSDVFFPTSVIVNIFCTKSPDKFYASFPIIEYPFPPAKLKTLDVDKLNIIKISDIGEEELLFSLPKKVNPGKTITVLNTCSTNMAVFDTIIIMNIQVAGLVLPNTLAKFIYIDSDTGWLRLFPNHIVLHINEQVGNE